MERVLVVDDDDELCQLVTRYLAHEGFETNWAPSGALGIERALSEDYSLIMLDVHDAGHRRFRRAAPHPAAIPHARADADRREVIPADRIRGLEMGARRLSAEALRSCRARRAHSRNPAQIGTATRSPASQSPSAISSMDGGSRTVAVERLAGGSHYRGIRSARRMMRVAGSTVSRQDLVRERIRAGLFAVRPQHRHARLQSPPEARPAR
jgi:DNA-binding response OmpR family regulator